MATPGSKPIDQLVRLAIIGDGNAFTQLWDAYIVSLRSFLKGWLKNVDDFTVDDICSRSFEKAFRQIKSYDMSRSQFGTWLRTIARNTALDLLEQENRMRRQTVSLDDGSLSPLPFCSIGDGQEDALDSIIRTEDRERTERYIKGLPELYRPAATCRLLDGMQYKEISEQLKLPLNTVRTHIRRAKSMIEKMKEDEI